jgi:hypothetical protein
LLARRRRAASYEIVAHFPKETSNLLLMNFTSKSELSPSLEEPLLPQARVSQRDFLGENGDFHGCESSSDPHEDRSSFDSFSSSSSGPTMISRDTDEQFTRLLKRAKRNVRRTLALTFFNFCGRSVWSQAPLAMFVALAYPHNLEYVGYVTAAMGFCQVISSSVSKWLMRRYQLFNNKVLVVTSILGVLATAASVRAIFIHSNGDTTNATTNFTWLTVAMILWGAVSGVLESILPIVFMESASLSEHQEKKYRRYSRLITGGNVAGTAIALGMFYWLGNKWTLSSCAVVMGVGLLLNLQVFFLLCSLRILPIDENEELGYEDYNLEFESDHNDIAPPHQQVDDVLINIQSDDLEFLNGEVRQDDESGRNGQVEERTEANQLGCTCLHDYRVPLLISVSDILSSFAGGMSIRYFPIFLAQQVYLQPIYVQALYLIVPVGQWVSPIFARRLARFSGPLRTTILLQWAFVVLMVSMIAGHEMGLSACSVSILYVLHASLMNSTSILTRTTLSQHATEDTLQKWRVADKLQIVLWALGASMGGWIAGQVGMSINFFTTGVLQLIASLPLIYLCCTICSDTWVDMDKGDDDDVSMTDQDVQSSGDCFQDCVCDLPHCGGSPATSDATSVTHSTSSSEDEHFV